MRVFLFKLRPSSHSEDLTLIATFGSEERAEKAYDSLKSLLGDMDQEPEKYVVDWSPDEADVELRGNEILFSVYTAGDLDDVEDVLRELAEKVECFTGYQELVIEAEVPKGLTPESAMLVLDADEAEAVRKLTELCGRPEVSKDGDKQFFVWLYKGDRLYCEGTLYLPGCRFEVWRRRNWKVWGGDE